MPKVTFMPMNQICEAKEGESILDVAINHDIPIQHACGGFCACTTCHVHVTSGGETLSDLADEEVERLERAAAGVRLNSRLACQAKVRGDIVAEIVNLE